ncbi:MAG: hypothetical protein IKL18_08660 [Oscillospiraceae bacterium]|nr:hypothetical protein [Oscillospiraceae bacterium]MBR6658223.1 hypothetical protein [Oscillospiraceae bacterium]
MKKRNPEKESIVSWIIMGTGALLAVIGALITNGYKVNLLVWSGLFVIIVGILYHLAMVRCPFCGHSLAGYRPLPKTCPKCDKKFED